MVNNRNIIGDCRKVLKTMPEKSVQCCVTSPPYWGLRDYGVDGQLGLESTPEKFVSNLVEVFREVKRVLRDDGTLWLNLGDSYYNFRGYSDYQSKQTIAKHEGHVMQSASGKRNFKQENLKGKDLVGIPWRVARALQEPYYIGTIKNKDDRIWLAAMIDAEGCIFIHKRQIGQSNGQGYDRKSDTYSSCLEVSNTNESIVQACLDIAGCGSICRVERESKLKKRNQPLFRWNLRSNQSREILKEVYPYLVAKKHQARLAIGCPSSGLDAERAHLSLMKLHRGENAIIDFNEPDSLYEKGWYLRSDIIWSKNNPMPESVTDRPTKSHEYIFLLTKSAKYYYDQDAVREPQLQSSIDRANYKEAKRHDGVTVPNTDKRWNVKSMELDSRGANKKTVWTIPTQSFKGAHFATFPEKLVEPCIMAGSATGDLVLDPFGGSGTVGKVAEKLGRKWICIELNPEYKKIADERTAQVGLL